MNVVKFVQMELSDLAIVLGLQPAKTGATWGQRCLSCIQTIRSLIVVFFLGGALMGCGEKYTNEGGALAQEINRELISRGLCKDSQDCFEKLPRYGEHGDRVYINCYDINPKNKKILSVVIELIINRGIEITRGVPISLQAFPKPHDEYVNFKNFFSKKPIIKLEITE